MRYIQSICLAAFSTAILSACAGTPQPQRNDPCGTPSAQEMERPGIPSALPADSPAVSVPGSGTPSRSAADTAAVRPDSLAMQKDAAREAAAKTNLYEFIPGVVNSSFDRADSLLAAGNVDSAAALVEEFTVLKPLWEEWTARASKMESRIRSAQISREAALKPLAVKLSNLVATGADFNEIRAVEDSLVSFAPDDSLKLWARGQLQTAYRKTFAKYSAERDRALSLARDKGLFDDAEKMLSGISMRVPDFADTLHIPDALMEVSGLRMQESDADVAYWKTHDAKAALAEARKLSREKKYLEAKKLLLKLRASPLRAEANVELDSVGNAYCTEERTLASTLFAQSRSAKSKSGELLGKAVAALDRCLTEFPEYKQRATVNGNRDFLQKELEK